MEEKLKPKRILVIEDDRALNRAITFKLGRKGYEAISVFSAEDGLKVLAQNEPIDFIWLDLLLPGMNGFDFLKTIRDSQELRNKRVVVVSASGNEESERQAKDLGVVAYIVKSDYNLDDIIDRVARDI